MESVVLCDTCVLLDFLGNHGQHVFRVEQLLTESKAAISAVSVYELLRGVESPKHVQQRNQLIRCCTTLEVSPQIAEHATIIYTSLKKKGQLIHTEDIFIAATARH